MNFLGDSRVLVDQFCLESGGNLLQILKQGAYFLGKKGEQKRLDAFLQDHPHQPLDIVACGAQYGMNGIARLTLQVTEVDQFCETGSWER